MSSPSSPLLTSDWILPIIKEQLLQLHLDLQQQVFTNEALLNISKEYQQVFAKLDVADLADFAALAEALVAITQAMATNQVSTEYTDNVLHSSELLLQQLTHYVESGTYEKQQIADSQQQLHQVLLTADTDGKVMNNKSKVADSQSAKQHLDKNNIEQQGDSKMDTQRNKSPDTGNSSAPVTASESSNPLLKLLQSVMEEIVIPSDDEDCDPEIKEIFIEEAEEVLEEMAANMKHLPVLASDKQELVEVRRGFHTLKGSGRMAGAFSSAELAWAIENMLNRVLENTIEPTDGMHQLLQDVIQAYPDLINIFKQDGTYPEEMTLWMAAATLYAKNQHPEFDYKLAVAEQTVEPAADSTTSVIAAMTNDVEVDEQSQVVDAIDDIDAEDKESDDKIVGQVEAQDAETASTSVSAPIIEQAEADDVVLEVSETEVNETEASAVTIKENVATSQPVSDSKPVSDAQKKSGSKSTSKKEKVSSESMPATSSKASLEATLLEDLASANDRLKQVAHDTELVTSIEEAELKELFVSEAEELLATIETILATAKGKKATNINDEMVRAFHTLHGAASSQSLLAISDISATVEHSLDQLQQHDEPITESHLQLIEQSVQLIRSFINKHINKFSDKSSVSQSQQMQQDINKLQDALESSLKEEVNSHEIHSDIVYTVAELVEGIDDLLDAEWQLPLTLQATKNTAASKKKLLTYLNKLTDQGQQLLGKVSGSAKFVTVMTALIDAYQLLINSTHEIKNKALIDALVAAHEQLIGLFDSLAGSMMLKVNQDVIDQLVALTDTANKASDDKSGAKVANKTKGKGRTRNVTKAKSTAKATTKTKTIVASADTSVETQSQFSNITYETLNTDAELLAIFIEEAQEIDEESNRQFRIWQQNPESMEPVRVLQRHLHTIKGGANMASIESIAELSHEAETLYAYFLSGQISPSEPWIAVMQSVEDILSNQIEMLATQERSFYVPQVIEQLQTLAKTKQIADDYQLQLPITEATVSAQSQPVVSQDIDEATSVIAASKESDSSADLAKPAETASSSIQDLQIEQSETDEVVTETQTTIAPVWGEVNTEDTLLEKGASLPVNDDNIENSHIDKILENISLEGITTESSNTPGAESLVGGVADSANSVTENINTIELEFDRMKSDSWEGSVPDPDILSIYLEEADELLTSSDEHLKAIRDGLQATQIDDHDDATESSLIADEHVGLLQDLQRELHMFKGGAHMVHAYAMGDVAGALQSVYKMLEQHQEELLSPLTLQLVTLVHNWLKQAVYLLHHGINPPRAQSLLSTLDNFSKKPKSLEVVPDVSLEAYVQAVSRYEAWREARLGLRDISEMPPCLMTDDQPEEQVTASNEMIRVPTRLMEQMINLSGESSINCSRIERSVGSFGNTLNEMGTTVQRLAEQLRRMDIELEAQIRSQLDEKYLNTEQGFDPLEMDQYSALNQLSKSLAESASDLLDIKTTLFNKTQDTETLLLQLSQTQNQLQQGLMTSRMVPFSRSLSRLQRTVRQTANELGKSVELVVVNENDEIDRTILERITSPLEHMIRNAVDHGIETPEERVEKGKSPKGQIIIDMAREGSEIVIRLKDDGQGIDVESVRRKAVSRGLISAEDKLLTDLDIVQYIFHTGLSTASNLTQISGRGVGMDVVLTEVRQLGGSVSARSKAGEGAEFILRLPLTIAVADALVVRAGDQTFAIPLLQIERIERIDGQSLIDFYNGVGQLDDKGGKKDNRTFDIAGSDYRLRYLTEILFGVMPDQRVMNANLSAPVVLIKNATGQNYALHVDEIVGSRVEVVVKPLSRPLSSITGLSAATITGNGSVVLILDALALMRNAPSREIVDTTTLKDKAADKRHMLPQAQKSLKPKVLIVDDSVTVRKVTSRMLERQGYETYVARDGVEAVDMLETLHPDLMLLDIEMPRMDGFEVATHVRHTDILKDLPIIMITSRTGDKHRKRALQLGVNDYMGKPFQEAALISSIQALIGQMAGDNSG